MIYSALIPEAPGLADLRSPEEQERALVEHRALQRDARESGAFIAATPLAEAGALVAAASGGSESLTFR